MATRTIILNAAGLLFSLLYWGSIVRSLVVAFRSGFRFPRSMHYVAIGLLVIELAVLVLFPLEIRTIHAGLFALLASFPASPYFGWIVAGGPERLRDENR